MKLFIKHYLLSALLIVCVSTASVYAQSPLSGSYNKKADKYDATVIEWRRHFHQNPELSNREFKTAKKIAETLRSFGNIEVTEGVGKTGVVGVLRGKSARPVVALRADIDALPVTERVDVPYASKAKGIYQGNEVGVMHACGHDTHIACLLGTAKILSEMQNELNGTVKFLFQPAEEGAPAEDGIAGAQLMVKEGVMKNPDVDVVFGLHINSKTRVGQIGYKAGPAMAAADRFQIKIQGKQTHGGYPWGGVDPIVIGSQIVLGLQTIVSRGLELINEPAVVSVGIFRAGVRNNIIPAEAYLEGTIRSFDPDMQDQIHADMERIATNIAEAGGAKATVKILRGYPVTSNDGDLTQKMTPTLQRVVGKENLFLRKPVSGAEDFSYFANEVPGLFIFLGGMKRDIDPSEAFPHHTPDFFIDDSGLHYGVKALGTLTLDYMDMYHK